MNRPPSSKNHSKDYLIEQPWLAVAVIALIVLIGYYKIFLGYNFFIHEDWLALSNYTAGNKFSNGWRPDKGFGISHFYGDPGMWHPWSLFSFFDRAAPTRTFSHIFSVVVMGILAALSVYFFSRRNMPKFNSWVAVLLCPLVVFCFDAPGQHYARSFISLSIGMPFFLWLLYSYYQKPRWVHVLLSAFLFWFVAFLGNLWSLTQMLMLGFIFSIIYECYFKQGWGKLAGKFLFIYTVSSIIFVLLGAGVFYSFALEQIITGFVREKTIAFPTIALMPDYKQLLLYICGFFPFEGIPAIHELAAFNVLTYRLNGSIIFIFVFIFFLSRKAENFWEFALKTLLAVFFIHGFFVYGKLLPGYGAFYSFLTSKSSKLIAMYDFVFSLQTILVIWFVLIVNVKNVVVENKLGRRLQIWIAGVTAGCYGAVLILSFIAIFLPNLYFLLSDHIIPSLFPQKITGYSKELLAFMLSYNARRFQEVITPQMFMFLGLSLFIVGIFLKNSWLRWAAGLNKIVIAGVLLLNAFLLSWALYPLSNKPLVWERPEVKALHFEPTDRFYFVRNNKWEKTVEGFRRKWMDMEGGGHRENQVGLLEPPGLNISGLKSFNSKAENAFMQRIFEEAGYEYERLYYGTYFLQSELLDMAAVKYYYSDGVIDDLPPELELAAQFKQLYIYKNKAAWPYYYLARQIGHTDDHFDHPLAGTAYLDASDAFVLPDGVGAGSVTMTHFGYGDFTFDFNSSHEEFLVVADAWHPFWKAKANNEDLPVLKVNEMFKGVRLPAGQYKLSMYYDAAPYQRGIWVAVIAWVLFAFGFVLAWRNRGHVLFARNR